MTTIQSFQILPDRALGLLFIRPINLRPFDPNQSTSIGLNNTGIDGKALATDQPDRNAPVNHSLEHRAQNITVAEPSVPID